MRPDPLDGTPTPVGVVIADWHAAVGESRDPLTVAIGEQPEHGWEVHPDVDGRAPADDDEEPSEPPH